jgi:hypothetical protein
VENRDYKIDTYFDFDNYYKGKTVDADVKAFFIDEAVKA